MSDREQEIRARCNPDEGWSYVHVSDVRYLLEALTETRQQLALSNTTAGNALDEIRRLTSAVAEVRRETEQLRRQATDLHARFVSEGLRADRLEQERDAARQQLAKEAEGEFQAWYTVTRPRHPRPRGRRGQEGAAQVSEWIRVEDEMPKAGQEVLAVLQTPIPCIVMVQYAPKLTLPSHPDCDAGGDYDEARDEYFAAEGWYQCYQVNGSLDDEPFWKLEDRVSHWMPKPALPAPPAGPAQEK